MLFIYKDIMMAPLSDKQHCELRPCLTWICCVDRDPWVLSLLTTTLRMETSSSRFTWCRYPGQGVQKTSVRGQMSIKRDLSKKLVRSEIKSQISLNIKCRVIDISRRLVFMTSIESQWPLLLFFIVMITFMFFLVRITFILMLVEVLWN